MPTFIDMSNLTKRSTLTGNEEFQVSATEKVTSEQLAKFAQMLTGFSTINTTDGVINGESNLLEALQVLYKLSSGNGKIRMLNGGGTFGFAYCDALMSGFIVEVEIGQVYWIMDDNSFNGDYSTATDYEIINVIRNNGNSAQLGCIPITDWKDIHNNFYAIGTQINKKTNIVPVISTSNPSSGPQTTAPYIGFALIISNTLPYKAAYFVADGKGDFYYAFVTQRATNTPADNITWNKIGNGGASTITITDFANPPVEATNLSDGAMAPIFFTGRVANGPDYITSFANSYGYLQINKSGSSTGVNYQIITNDSLYIGEIIVGGAIKWYKVCLYGDNLFSPYLNITDFNAPAPLAGLPSNVFIPIFSVGGVNTPSDDIVAMYGYAVFMNDNSILYLMHAFDKRINFLGNYTGIFTNPNTAWFKENATAVKISKTSSGSFSFSPLQFSTYDGESYGSGNVYTKIDFLGKHTIQVYGQLYIKNTQGNMYSAFPFNVMLDGKNTNELETQNINVCKGIFNTSNSYYITASFQNSRGNNAVLFEFGADLDTTIYLKIMGVNLID